MSRGNAQGQVRPNALTLESGLEALHASADFHGPVEPLDGHESNDHLALIYEDEEEQFAAVAPFVRQGLERGERCMYIADENTEAEVLEALRARGIDVDAALESGALTLHTRHDTYCRDGEFDPDEMISFLADSIDESLEEYEGLRVTGEMTWVFGDEPRMADLIEYEGKLNRLFPHVDGIALCQYNRERFPAEAIRDVIRTHPHLIYRNTVCQNFYYTPPEEFFGPDRPSHEIDRMMRTLLDRTDAKVELQERERFQRELYEITANGDLDFHEKVERLLELGRKRFGFDIGFLMRQEGERFRVVEASGAPDAIEEGVTTVEPDPDQYCRQTVRTDGPLTVEDAAAAGWDDDPLYREYGLRCYMGLEVTDGSGTYGTICFSETSPHVEEFSDAERTFLELMGQWVSHELERGERERYLREQNEITADSDGSFEEKLADVFELGRERFGLELGAMARVDPETDRFEIEHVSGDHERFEPGFRLPLSETFCSVAADGGGVASVSDPPAEGHGDLTVHRNFGLETYLGTCIDVEGGPDRTFFFVSSEPREWGFSDEEREFLRLMSQWVKHELERRHREADQQELYEIAADTTRTFEEKLSDVFELGCERFGLELGGVARIDPETDLFEVETMSGDHEHLVPGARAALSETYCRILTDDCDGDGAASVTDPAECGFGDSLAYEEFGVRAYLGTRVEVEGAHDRTFFFVSSEPRERGFSEEERTFHRLMGQWLAYEFERKRREDRLAELNALNYRLMEAATAEEVSGLVVDAASDLGLPALAVGLYDEREGVLRDGGRTDDAAAFFGDASPLDVGGGVGWEAFVEGDSRRVAVPTDEPATGDADTDEVAAVPLDNHGVLVAASTGTAGFSSSEFDFVETVAANTRAALDRAARERELQERERSLEEQNEALERLDRINGIIRSIDQSLVEATSRDEIEAVVCEQLADVGPYEFAWIADACPTSGEVTPRESAGAEKGYLDEISVAAGDGRIGEGPLGRAVRTREPQAVDNILTDASFEPWRQAALNRGYHAALALPLVYDDSLYGVLTVYAGNPGVFDGLAQAVLAELSDTVAFAINAIESKKALVSAEVTELEFRVEDDLPVLDLSRRVGCDVNLETCIPRTDGSLRVFFSTWGAPAADVLDAASGLALDGTTLVSEYEEDGENVALFEVAVTGDSICRGVLEHGGVVKRLDVSDGAASVRVELPSDAEIREFVDMFRTKFSGAELLAQRTRERDRHTLTEFSARLREELTERQFEVLETAYYSGFFETPRPRNGGEIAESLGVTQPTFNHHLRVGHRKLCRLLFEEGDFRNLSA